MIIKLLQRDLFEIRKCIISNENIGLIICRQGIAANLDNWDQLRITNIISDINMFR